VKKALRDEKINTRGRIFYKSIQISAYADDIDIAGRSQAAMKESVSLEKAAKETQLQVNKEKNKKDYAHVPPH
jgi:sorting nexin-29